MKGNYQVEHLSSFYAYSSVMTQKRERSDQLKMIDFTEKILYSVTLVPRVVHQKQK